MLKQTASLLMCILAPWVCGCTLFNDSNPGTSDPNFGRIINRRSIDSVMPGFTTTEVTQYVGEPTAIGLGDYAGFTYYYGGNGSTGPEEIEILFSEDFSDRVVHMMVNPPYPGKTKEGIGLGSAKKAVRGFLGTPDTNEVTTNWMRLGGRMFRGDVYFRGDSIAIVFQYDSRDHVYQINLVRLSLG